MIRTNKGEIIGQEMKTFAINNPILCTLYETWIIEMRERTSSRNLKVKITLKELIL